ncbi:MAG: AsmA family protein, partial [Elusimicrobiota bacterium]
MEKKTLLRKLLKIAAVLAALGLIAAGIGTWALKRYLPPEKLRELVLTQASKALQREISVGDISIGLVQGMVIERLAISERPDFKAGRFAEAESFSLRLRLLPLLHKKIEVDKVSADGLVLNISRRTDGTFNFSDLAGSTAAAKGASAEAGASLALSVSKAALRNAQITYKDPGQGQDIKISGLNAKLAHFSLEGPFSADIELQAAGKIGPRPLAASLAFSGKLDLGGGKLELMSAQVKGLKVTESGREVRLSGKISNGKAPKLDIEASVFLSGKEILSAALEGALTSTGPKPAGDIQMKLRTPGFDPGAVRLAELIAAGLPKGVVVPETRVEGRLLLAGEELKFESLKADTKLLRLEASGRLTKIYSGRPEPDLKASVHVEAPRMTAQDAPWLKLPANITVPASILDAQLRLKPWEVTFESLRLKNSVVQLDASGTVVDLLAAMPRPQELKIKIHADLPQIAAADAPWLKLPIGLIVPAAGLDAELALKSWDAAITMLKVKAPGAQIEASGAVRDLLGKPKPEGLKAKLHLDSSQIKASALAWLKLPAGLALPAVVLDTNLKLEGEDLRVESLLLKSSAGEIQAKGTVRKAMHGPMDPDLDEQAKLDLPAFKSADIPLAGVPPGLVVPASQLELSALGGLDHVELRRLRAVIGKNDLEVSGKIKAARSADPGLDLLLKCRSFLLEEITAIAPQTRDLKLKGSGLFALGLTGPLSKPVLSGKMKFSGLGADAAGLPLSEFTGTASFDERRIDIHTLSGK